MAIKQMAVANDIGFQRQIKYYMEKAATEILGEEFGGENQPTAQEHDKRVVYANSVLDGSAKVYEYAVAVTTNSTVATKIDNNGDYSGDLEFVVNSLFSDFSGYDKDE